MRDLWLTRREAIKIDKIKKSLTVPAASYPCGRINNSVFISNASPVVAGVVNATTCNASRYSVEIWANPIPLTFNTEILNIGRDAFGNFSLRVKIGSTGLIVIDAYDTAGTVVSFSTNIPFIYYNWNSYTITRDYTVVGTVTTIRLYINGTLVYTGTTALLNNGTIGPSLMLSVFGDQANGCSQLGYFAEFRFWNATLTNDEVYFRYNKFIGKVPYSTLKAYFPITPVEGVTSISNAGNDITLSDIAINGTTQQIVDDVSPPLKYGASLVAAQFEVNLDRKCSLKFPTTPPSGTTGMLVVRWTDDDGVVQRRRLWNLDGVNIAPFPELYDGEKLMPDFVLEWWNIDGEETIEVPEDIVLYVSITTAPTTASDTTSVAAQTVVISSSLGETYDITFPADFDQPLVFN